MENEEEEEDDDEHLKCYGGQRGLPGVGCLGVGHGGTKHAAERLPLVEADGIAHEHYLLAFQPPQHILPIEPSQQNIHSLQSLNIRDELCRCKRQPKHERGGDLGSSQASGFHRYLRYSLSGRP